MHGDINGQCVYVESSGRVVLTDFGLAQAVASNRRFKGTLGNIRMVVGVENAGYLAPERVQGQGPTRAADIYALGIIAYQLLARETPFSGEQEAVLEAHVYKTPPPLQGISRAVSPSLSGAVARLCRRNLNCATTQPRNSPAHFWLQRRELRLTA